MSDLNKIHTELELLKQELRMSNEIATRRLHHIESFVYGNGQPGAKIRLDRLEQIQARYRWFIVTLSSTVLALTVASIWAAVVG